MYVPGHFKVEDGAALRSFMESHAFAIVVTQGEGGSLASHLPMLLERGEPLRMVAHMARANGQWRHLEKGGEVLVIFHGPHGYVSPFWYEAEEAVPTWNYTAVHAYGRGKIMDDPARVREMVERLTRYYEGARAEGLFARWSEAFVERMLKGIVAFEVEVTRLEGKFKLSQNRSAADVAKVGAALMESANPGDRALAELMKEQGLGC